MKFITMLGLALAPGLAIMLYIYLKDKHEREPIGLLIMSFIYGLASACVTLFISGPINSLVSYRLDNIIDQFNNAFFNVAFVEEFSKFIFIRFILYYNKNFNEPFDGIVYAVMVGMGFATFENVIYVWEYGFVTAVLRMFTAVPAHATFAILMGYFIGKARFSHKNVFMYSFFSLLVATFYHGAYDYFWFISFIPGLWICAVVSLLAAFFLSRNAIRLHQQASPFIKRKHH